MFQRIQGVGLGLLIATAVVALAAFGTSLAQNAPQGFPLDTSFTYQGRLEVDGIPAEGMYDFEFEFWDSSTGGTKLQTLNKFDVQVTNGLFSVLLDSGGHLQGEQRYLAIAARPVGGGSFVALGDRQELTPSPYAIYARTAGQLSSEAAAGFIQNGTTEQPTSNFYISGDGTAAGTLSANAFAINGVPMLRRLASNTLLGESSGSSITIGDGNTAAGRSALADIESGNSNNAFGNLALVNLSTGSHNVGVGVQAGFNLTTQSGNTFVGTEAGFQARTNANTALGFQAGREFTTGTENVFLGHTAGRGVLPDSTGSQNVAVGTRSGFALSSGASNALFGDRSGEALSTGSGNTFLGKDAAKIATDTSNSTIVGFGSGSSSNAENSSFFGYNSGLNVTSGADNTFIGKLAGLNITSGSSNTALGSTANFNSGALTFSTAIGAGAQGSASSQVQLGRNGLDTVRIGTLAGPGTSDVCLSGLVFSSCSSSLRYKTNLADYTGGLDILEQFRPVTFDWKSDGSHDLGFVAEDVAAIDPLLATYRDGVVEGVKYDRISAVLVNSVMEQQAQIDALASGVAPADRAELDALRADIAALQASADDDLEAALADRDSAFGMFELLAVALLAGLTGAASVIGANRLRAPRQGTV